MSDRPILGYVFGYGTLADPNDWLLARFPGEFDPPVYLFVEGFRRHWDLAAANIDPDHDHKYHADAGSDERPDIYVAALGLEPAEGIRCNGVAIPVDETRLGWFDQREGRLYDRIVIKPERISEQLDGPLWTYYPKDSAAEDFAEGMKLGTAFVPAYYLERMNTAFGNRDEKALADYHASTREPRCPVRDLELVRAPGDAGI